jgi:NitT/TauT family transport system ATP-binding protein
MSQFETSVLLGRRPQGGQTRAAFQANPNPRRVTSLAPRVAGGAATAVTRQTQEPTIRQRSTPPAAAAPPPAAARSVPPPTVRRRQGQPAPATPKGPADHAAPPARRAAGPPPAAAPPAAAPLGQLRSEELRARQAITQAAAAERNLDRLTTLRSPRSAPDPASETTRPLTRLQPTRRPDQPAARPRPRSAARPAPARPLHHRPAPAGPLLQAKNLDHPLGIFTGLSFTAPAKRLVALIGPSGVGKTSLFRTFLNDSTASHQLLWNDRPLYEDGDCQLSFALVPQRPALIPNLRVKSLLHYAYRLKTKGQPAAGQPAQERRRTDEALKLAGFTWATRQDRDQFRNQFCANLSGGETTRLSLALELLDYPDALLLDEPTSGLDAHAGKKVVDAMKRLLEESAVQLLFFITHTLDELRPTDWVVALGTPAPGQKPAHVAYCGPRGDPAARTGIYGALDAADDADLMAKLARNHRAMPE